MKLIKLTKDGTTRNNTKWEIGKTVSIDEELRRPKLYSNGVLHAYESIEQALAMKISHLHYGDADLKIYEVEGDVVVKDCSKVGCYELTPIKEIPLPGWYTNIELRLKILTRFVCYCALEVIDIFEDKYPNDNRPRNVIDEALKYGTDEFNADATYDAYITTHNIIYTYTNRAVEDAAYVAVLCGCIATDAVANAERAAADTAATVAHIAHEISNTPYIINYHVNITALMQKAIRDFM